MANLTIRNIDERIKSRPRVNAAGFKGVDLELPPREPPQFGDGQRLFSTPTWSPGFCASGRRSRSHDGSQPASELCITDVTEAEIRVGVNMMPDGKRKAQLQATVDQTLSQVFAGRILPFDSAAAVVCAEISASRRSIGRPISPFDAKIAAFLRVNGATGLATRNRDDFASASIKIAHPWETR